MVRWVNPLRVPLHRRIETLCTLITVVLPLSLILLNVLCILVPLLWPLYLAVIAWTWWDRNTPRNGGRPLQWLRMLPIWKPFREYFPAKLIAMEKLDPANKYIFGVHPHGIISISTWANLMNGYSESSEILKNIKHKLAVLALQFKIPFFRDFALGMGLISVDGTSIRNAIKKGNSVFIIIGGAAESLDAHPGRSALVLKRRRGFIRLALETGSHLVPVYCFGENNLFNQVPNEEGTKLRGWQESLKAKLGFTLPVFHGRGIWNYDFGLLPYRFPLVTVLGKPIPVPFTPSPSEEDINKYHELYIKGLTEVFEQYKGLENNSSHMKIY